MWASLSQERDFPGKDGMTVTWHDVISLNVFDVFMYLNKYSISLCDFVIRFRWFLLPLPPQIHTYLLTWLFTYSMQVCKCDHKCTSWHKSELQTANQQGISKLKVPYVGFNKLNAPPFPPILNNKYILHFTKCGFSSLLPSTSKHSFLFFVFLSSSLATFWYFLPDSCCHFLKTWNTEGTFWRLVHSGLL